MLNKKGGKKGKVVQVAINYIKKYTVYYTYHEEGVRGHNVLSTIILLAFDSSVTPSKFGTNS